MVARRTPALASREDRDVTGAPTGRSSTYTSTHARLLDGTARVAVEQGLRDMTVELILQSASVSRRTFYQHFRNIEEALKAVYERVTIQMVRAIRDRIEPLDDPMRRLFAGLDAYLDYQLQGGQLVGLLQIEAANPASSLFPLREQLHDSLVQFIDREITAELGGTLDPLLYRSVIIGMEGMITHLRRGGGFTAAERDRVAAISMHQVSQLIASAREGAEG